MSGVLVKEERWCEETQEEYSHLQPKGGLAQILLLALRRNQLCQHPDFELPASSVVRPYISVNSVRLWNIYYGSRSKLIQLAKALTLIYRF